MDSGQQHQPLAEMLGLAACLLLKNLAAWHCGSRGRPNRGITRSDGNFAPVGRVERIVIYPVKSCSGIELLAANVAECGLVAPGGVRDRSYLVLSEANAGRFVSLKTVPRMSAVRPLLDPDRPGAIRLSAEGQPTVLVTPTSRQIRVAFRSETLTGLDCGDEVAGWLGRVLGSDGGGYRLVHCPRGQEREALRPRMRQVCDPDWAEAVPDNPLAYADASPILLLSDKSMLTLNERLAQNATESESAAAVVVDWRNFRPNLVVSGVSQAHDEDAWGCVRIGGRSGEDASPQLGIMFQCERCAMVNLRYSADGLAKTPAGNPVLGPLAAYRCAPPFRNPLFGANCAVLASGPIALGDPVFADRQLK